MSASSNFFLLFSFQLALIMTHVLPVAKDLKSVSLYARLSAAVHQILMVSESCMMMYQGVLVIASSPAHQNVNRNAAGIKDPGCNDL